jgi:hypothetical protein
VVNAEAYFPYSLHSGKVIKARIPPLRFTVGSCKTLGDVLGNPWGYLVWSSRLRGVLARLTRDAVQYLPTVIDDVKRERTRDYRLANPLVLVDALDEARSRLHYADDGYIEFVDRLVIDDKRVGNSSLFRLSAFPADVIVRAHIAESVLQSGCTGVKFVPIADYRV